MTVWYSSARWCRDNWGRELCGARGAEIDRERESERGGGV